VAPPRPPPRRPAALGDSGDRERIDDRHAREFALGRDFGGAQRGGGGDRDFAREFAAGARRGARERGFFVRVVGERQRDRVAGREAAAGERHRRTRHAFGFRERDGGLRDDERHGRRRVGRLVI